MLLGRESIDEKNGWNVLSFCKTRAESNGCHAETSSSCSKHDMSKEPVTSKEPNTPKAKNPSPPC